MDKICLLVFQSPYSAVLKPLCALLVTLGAFSAHAMGPEPIVCEAQTRPLGHGEIELSVHIQNKTDDLELRKNISADEYEELLGMSFTAEEVAELLADHNKAQEEKEKRQAKKLAKAKPQKEGLFAKLMKKLMPFGMPLPTGSSVGEQHGPFDDGDEFVLIMPIEKYNTNITIKVDPVGLTLFSLTYGPRIKKMAGQKELLHFFTGMEFTHEDIANQSYRLSGFAAHCTLETLN